MKKIILSSVAAAAVILTSGCGVVGNINDSSSQPAPSVSEETVTADNTENTESATETTAESAETTEEIIDTPEAEVFEESEVQNNSESANAPAPSDPDYAPAPAKSDRTDITYIGGMLMANKTYSLPADYAPGLDETCESQFNKLTEDAAKEGLNIYFASGFRSYEYQSEIYNNYVNAYGQESADTFSARPGYSEHQSGLAIDVNSIDDSFRNTPEAIWLAIHCHEYGFIIRYPEGKQDITGYKYEPWHIRYVGTDLSYPIYESGLTVEEYFDITSEYAE